MTPDPLARITARRRRSIVGFAVLWIAVMSLAACTVRLIGDYDDSIDKGITDIHQKAELYFAKLLSTPNTALDQSFYDGISANLAVLKSRAASLPKYEIVVEQIGNLKSQFDSFQALDRITPRPFPKAIVTSAESGIAVSVESILKLELALKRGGTSASSTPPKPANNE